MRNKSPYITRYLILIPDYLIDLLTDNKNAKYTLNLAVFETIIATSFSYIFISLKDNFSVYLN